MGKYVLLAETGADIPADIAKRYGIWKVPMHVTFDTETKNDGDFPTTDVFDHYKRTGRLPKTSGSTPDDFEQIFDRIHAEYPDRHILHLAYSAATTCSYQSALLAARNRDYVTSIDTMHVSAGQALVVIFTARYLEEHPDCSLQQVTQEIKNLSCRCRMGFFPGNLEYLKAGGRVSNAAYLGAKILSLNPLIELVGGKLEATKKYRGSMQKVAPRLFEDYPKAQNFSREAIAFVYSPGLARTVREEVERRAREKGYEEIFWIETGCVVSTHSGPGAFGISGFARPNK